MSELKTNHHCYKSIYNVIKTFGFTKDPKLNDYILVIQYASEGDLHKYLQKKFAEINWKQKIHILINILIGLEAIHNANFIHRDVHSENILVDLPSKYYVNCKIGDLGLSRPANDTSSDNEIYGVIPYIAPEIFKGSAFSKESDIYSLGMIMWELTTDCKPFANVEYDHTLLGPDPKKRPSIYEIEKICYSWNLGGNVIYQFYQAEFKRIMLIDSKNLSPKFRKKPHPKAVYTSRPLSSYIFKCSSTNFSLNNYISKELEFDIDIESNKSNVLETKRNIEELNINSYENNENTLKLIPIYQKQ
ncbi:Bck1p [Rhizophagus irregularis DAOM 197198w]|uniref:Bck1p n=2 Tax=Rhizophagus irregularis TaxID=588596 RepID=A0A015IUE3_RHIIW|nr:Bck1p [Rhizophagus irregularis DAOM 197198w]